MKIPKPNTQLLEDCTWILGCVALAIIASMAIKVFLEFIGNLSIQDMRHTIHEIIELDKANGWYK